MTPSPLVPVEGALARPRATPLDHIPPFGREWRFRGAPGARPSKNCLATLTTSCIDVDQPHRACRWQPLSTAASASAPAASPATPATATSGRFRHTTGKRHERRAMYAACWSIGALGIIGWLIAAHEPSWRIAPAFTIQTTGPVPDHASSFSGTVQVATVQLRAPEHATAPRIASAPVVNTAESPPAPHRVTARPAALHPDAIPDSPLTVAASPHRPNNRHIAAATVRTPAVARQATPPSIQRNATRSVTRDRLVTQPSATGTLDDPLALIAMADALRTAGPARASHATAPGFDWTSQLSHRRLTDTPDAFAR